MTSRRSTLSNISTARPLTTSNQPMHSPPHSSVHSPSSPSMPVSGRRAYHTVHHAPTARQHVHALQFSPPRSNLPDGNLPGGGHLPDDHLSRQKVKDDSGTDGALADGHQPPLRHAQQPESSRSLPTLVSPMSSISGSSNTKFSVTRTSSRALMSLRNREKVSEGSTDRSSLSNSCTVISIAPYRQSFSDTFSSIEESSSTISNLSNISELERKTKSRTASLPLSRMRLGRRKASYAVDASLSDPDSNAKARFAGHKTKSDGAIKVNYKV